VEKFWPGYSLEDSRAEASGYAIIQDPGPGRLDDKGYYSTKWQDLMFMSSILKELDEIYAESGGLQKHLKELHGLIKGQLRNILAGQEVLHTVSDVIGVNFTEDIDLWIGRVDSVVRRYNLLITGYAGYTHGYGPLPKDLKLPPLKIDNLKPNSQYLAYFRERIAMSLGEDWWETASGEFTKLVSEIYKGAETVERNGNTYVIGYPDQEEEEEQSGQA
jgi:hypothetical protein